MAALTITELELTPGIWTPQAKIHCVVCHMAQTDGRWSRDHDGLINDERFKEQPLDDAMDSTVGVCDECGKSIWMPYKIAWEQKVVAALKKKGHHDARMEQTGGMCSAAGLYLPGDEDGGQKYVWVTESEEDTGHDTPTFLVGYYHIENPYGDDAEGEDCVTCTFDEAVALTEKIAKEGRA